MKLIGHGNFQIHNMIIYKTIVTFIYFYFYCIYIKANLSIIIIIILSLYAFLHYLSKHHEILTN